MSSPVAAVVEVLARALVDAPDAVRVSETAHRGTTVVELTVAPGDTGKVIGRQGRIAEALRTLVAATAHKHGMRATLEIRDPE
ncbi:MAG TPA: KH domain-containing protein [Vicinamibacterales bacterium]